MTNDPSRAQLFDLNMLVMTGGQERTVSEYGALLARQGSASPRYSDGLAVSRAGGSRRLTCVGRRECDQPARLL